MLLSSQIWVGLRLYPMNEMPLRLPAELQDEPAPTLRSWDNLTVESNP
ncbi:hypothetical protein H6F56_12215 [Microcoleus sp. FACHB-672]|nr:hypothetical protein [Microcoleus sp. FACHB-672]